MKATLYSKQGKKKKEVVLNPAVFAAHVNHRLLELVHNAYAANLRHGTADTKTRKEVRGGGKKPWRQKGTGRARHGSIRSPIWRKGGTVFGPHPRDYTVDLPKGMRKRALISALSLRGEQKNLFLLEDTRLDTSKTKEWAGIVKSLPLDGKRALCVVKEFDGNFQRVSRNLSSWIKVQEASDLNAYHILQREKLIIEEEALGIIEERVQDVLLSEEPQAESPAESKTQKKPAGKPRAGKKK